MFNFYFFKDGFFCFVGNLCVGVEVDSLLELGEIGTEFR
jgi:hypothetical protein